MSNITTELSNIRYCSLYYFFWFLWHRDEVYLKTLYKILINWFDPHVSNTSVLQAAKTFEYRDYELSGTCQPLNLSTYLRMYRQSCIDTSSAKKKVIVIMLSLPRSLDPRQRICIRLTTDDFLGPHVFAAKPIFDSYWN